MSTLPLCGPKFRAFDSNGNPLSGGKLYSYAAGTTDPLDTFTTRFGNVPNENPVILDANGEADVWTSIGVLYKFVLKDAGLQTQWTVDNFPSGSAAASTTSDLANAMDPGGRLSVSSGTPVTTSDVLEAATVFYVPYKNNKVPLYDGSEWALHAIATELSQSCSDNTKSPAAAATGQVYDMFVWNDAGTLRLSRGPLWSSPGSARGTGAGTTELERLNGRYVNKQSISNGPAAQRGLYVGTIRISVSGVDDSIAGRHCWNAYNRVRRAMRRGEATSSWTYSTTTWRAANNDPGNQLAFVIGLSEDEVEAEVLALASGPGPSSTIPLIAIGIGLDSSTTPSSTIFYSSAYHSTSPTVAAAPRATYQGFPGIGHHVLRWLEIVTVGGDVTFFGAQNSADAIIQTGIWGHLFA